MAIKISGEHGFVIASAPYGLTGATIWLDFPSVGATENLLLAAVLASGITEIDNAAREPEIVDLCAMLTAMGARISGAGTSRLEIEGVGELVPVRHRCVGDRIVAGTWAYGAAMTRGDVTVTGVDDPRFIEIALDKLVTHLQTDGHHAVVQGRERLSSAPVRATDIRAGAGLVMAALCTDGDTGLSHVHHIDRGYPGFVPDCSASAPRWRARPLRTRPRSRSDR